MQKLRLCSTALLVLLAMPVFGQAKKRITVLPLKDRTGSGAKLNVSQKAADEILSKLAETGQFTVVERDQLAAIGSERNLKFDADFNPVNAPKSGLQTVCDYIVIGQIDEFSANQESTEKANYISKKTEVTGTTALKISLRVVSTETGNIVAAPTARAEKTATLGKSSASLLVTNVGSKASTVSTDAALTKLVDSEIEDVATEIADKITKSAGITSTVAAATGPVLPKFVGIDEGNAMINKGANAGIKIGQQYDIVHSVDTGMVDPDTNKPILKHKVVCRLTIASVDDTTAEGKCPGGTPAKGDELREAGK